MEHSTIRPANLDDCTALGVVGPAAYASAYHELWDSPVELARHLRSFGETPFHTLLQQTDTYVWVAETAGEVVGFLSLVIGSTDPLHHEAEGAEIPRIFLLPQARAKGFGRRLLEAAERTAVEQNVSYLWLDAMDSADWALATYKAWGFQPIGRTTFPKAVKPEYSGMVVFRKSLT
jgi:GNAT superfamily N-acetyltransferase